MLSDNDAIATVAVKNLETAKQFYEGTLGLTKVMENEEVLAFKTGKSTLFVYPLAIRRDEQGYGRDVRHQRC